MRILRISPEEIFGCDYTDLNAVIRLAKAMGKGMTVFQHPGRPNYNITHTERTDQYRPEWVKFQT